MRLVIDLQGAQTGSRFRGIGRYSLSIAKAMAKVAGSDHEIIIALSGLLPEAHEAIRAEFTGLLPPENIRVWNAVGPVREVDDGNRWRCHASERIRETFLASLKPDVIFITSLFEGLGDDAVGSIDILKHGIPTAVLLHDLIPLVNPDEHFRASGRHRRWYRRKIRSLKRSSMLLAVSESSRQEALSTGLFRENDVVAIYGACGGEFRILPISMREKGVLWNRLGISRPFVMYTGAADERKNLYRLIESYAGLPPSVRRKHQLVFAGKMPRENVQGYVQTAQRCGLSDDELLFTGYVEDLDLIKLYNTCEVFIFPSTHEGFGLPVLEAMACGAPVIGSNAKSLPEVIGLQEAQFDPLSVPDICSKLEHVLTNRKFRVFLQDHGAKQLKRFSWERSAQLALDALQTLVVSTSSRASHTLMIESTACFERRRLRILVVKLDHLGDFILAIPAFSKLRSRYPYASISIVLGSWNVPIAKELNLFDEIYVFDFFKRQSSELPSMMEESLTALLERLGHFDIAVDLRRPADTRFVLMRVNADVKVAYETRDESMDTDLDIALTVHPDIPFRASPLNRTSVSLQMLRVIDAIPTDPNDFVVFPEFSSKENSERGRVAIFPKAGNAAREWSKSNFEQLVSLLAADPVVEAIDVYFSNEHDKAGFAFVGSPKIKSLAGLSFADLTRALSSARVCIANNSGGGHLASYLGLKVLGVYSGHELPQEWGLQFFDAVVLHRGARCAPCHGARREDCPHGLFCLTDIAVKDVYTKTIEGLVSRQNDDPAPRGSVEYDTDFLVRRLLDSIAQLDGGNERDTIEAALSISSNHPNYSLPDVASLPLNVPTDHKSPLVEWRGFSGIEPEFRWTEDHNVAMLFECPEGTPPLGTLIVKIDTLGEQRIAGIFNKKRIIETMQSGTHIPLSIPVDNLESGLNILEFNLPDARLPGNGDGRLLGIAVREFMIQVAQSFEGRFSEESGKHRHERDTVSDVVFNGHMMDGAR